METATTTVRTNISQRVMLTRKQEEMLEALALKRCASKSAVLRYALTRLYEEEGGEA